MINRLQILALLLVATLLAACGSGGFNREIASHLSEKFKALELPTKISRISVKCAAKDLNLTYIEFEAVVTVTENLYDTDSASDSKTASQLNQANALLSKMKPALTEEELKGIPESPEYVTVAAIQTPKGTAAPIRGTILIDAQANKVDLVALSGDLDVFKGKPLEEGWVGEAQKEGAIRAYTEKANVRIAAIESLWRQKIEPIIAKLREFPKISGTATQQGTTMTFPVTGNFILSGNDGDVSGSIEWPSLGVAKNWRGKPDIDNGQVILRMEEIAGSISPSNVLFGIIYKLSPQGAGWSGPWSKGGYSGTVTLGAVDPVPTRQPITNTVPTPTASPIPPVLPFPPTTQPLQEQQTGGTPMPGVPQDSTNLIAVKVDQLNNGIIVHLYDGRTKERVDTSKYFLDPEPTLGERVQVEDRFAVYVGAQAIGSPTTEDSRQIEAARKAYRESAQATLPYSRKIQDLYKTRQEAAVPAVRRELREKFPNAPFTLINNIIEAGEHNDQKSVQENLDRLKRLDIPEPERTEILKVADKIIRENSTQNMP